MKSKLLLIITIICTYPLFSNILSQKIIINALPRDEKQQRVDFVLYEESFENGENGWTTLDYTTPSNWDEAWLISAEGAYEGNSWWMHDPNISGYHNHRYVVLDSPVISLGSSPASLTFKMNYSMEPPGTTDDYNGWDGFNVRISTDNGNTWNVLEGFPEYTADSFYSFGEEFNEGVGIPAWGGTSNGWQDVEMDLSQYVNQNIKIRFAFASDQASCTVGEDGNNNWFGVRLDNINIANLFFSNADGQSGDDALISGYAGEVYGDFWELSSLDANSGSYAYHCDVHPNLQDELISPYYPLPNNENIYFSYFVKCDLLDSDGNGDDTLEDFYHVFVKGDTEQSWRRVHYAYNQDLLGSDWQEVGYNFATTTPGWSLGSIDLTPWAGQNIQVKFRLQTDDNDDGGIGEGLFIDDFKIFQYVYLPTPTNLTAENTENIVNLDWQTPGAFSEELVTSTNNLFDSYVNYSDPYAMKIENPYNEDVILSNIDFILFNTSEVIGDVKLFVWESQGGLPSEEPILELENINGMQNLEWFSVDISSYQIVIPPNSELFIGIGDIIDDDGNQGLMCDSSSDRLNSFCTVAGEWVPLNEQYPDAHNIGMRARILVPDENSFRPIGYNIYHSLNNESFELIGYSEGLHSNHFTHTNPTYNQINYYNITAVYENNYESNSSNIAQVYVAGITESIIANDDGSSESSINAGVNNHIAVKFHPEIAQNIGFVKLIAIQIYITDVNDDPLIVKGWFNQGGMPSTSFMTYVHSENLMQGWNIIQLPEYYQIELTDDFFIGVYESQNSSSLGLDEDNSGESFLGTSNWSPISDGNVMIRTIVDQIVSTNDSTAPKPILSLNNYPNPFNPITQISFDAIYSTNAKLIIYNIKGQCIKNIFSGKIKRGHHTFIWDGTDNKNNDVSSGIYFYKLETSKHNFIKKMMLLK